VDTPLLDTEDKVHYCFLPLDLVAKYPVLVNDDNLLWLLENAALIKCNCSEFRFIVNFLRSEKMLLPDDFSNIDALEEEVLILRIPELINAVKAYRGGCSTLSPATAGDRDWQGAAGVSLSPSPLYAMALGLLVNYPDSILGQLCVGSDLGRSHLHLSGNGILFQHIRNWLGTCRLPLTKNISEIKELCTYLDQRDAMYKPMKDALRCYLKQQAPAESWSAEVSVCSLHQIVRVYVGSNWYETYLRTLLKYPELLSNDKKVCWITYGQTLLIHGDGQMFRHVLNFLRLGKLFLPAEFKEWPLFCQEAEEYQIPSLLEALYHSDAYRLWIQNNESHNEEQEFSKDPKEVRFDLKGKQDTSGKKAKHSRMFSGVRETKRRNRLGEYDASSGSLVNSSYYKHLASPPRERGIRRSLTKKVESKASASHIQKSLSLAKEWDAVSSRRCDFQHIGRSAVRAEGEQPEQYMFTHSLQVNPSAGMYQFGTVKTPPAAGNGAGNVGKEPAEGKPLDSQQTSVVLAGHRNVGLILRVDHPPVLGSDGFCSSDEESVVYSTLRGGSQLATPSAPALYTVFLTFALSHEEMFYARQCHFFLTDVILDSVRQRDPKAITAKIGSLVNRLWTRQITPGEFVTDLLNTENFKKDRNIPKELLQWVEFSLPFAWKYSHCLNSLIQRGFARSVSYFVLEM
uniref:BTB/POZ domain-containing protein KCTD19 n=1 Tax=Falco tinnunculus TaxID=100819 RepID=A0A8C4UQV8_FALTI